MAAVTCAPVLKRYVRLSLIVCVFPSGETLGKPVATSGIDDRALWSRLVRVVVELRAGRELGHPREGRVSERWIDGVEIPDAADPERAAVLLRRPGERGGGHQSYSESQHDNR